MGAALGRRELGGGWFAWKVRRVKANEVARPFGVASGGYTKVLAGASLWGLLQISVNKIATVVAMWLLARFLMPSDYGVAYIATTAGALISFFSPFVIGDVLVQMGRDFDRQIGAATVIAAVCGVLLAAVLWLASPVIGRELEVPDLAFYISLVALRPLCDAVMIVPYSRLRVELRFRTIAIIDTCIVLCSTAASLVMAWKGLGAMALVLPPIATLALRGCVYWTCKHQRLSMACSWSDLVGVSRRFCMACVGQYASNVIQVMEFAVLAWISVAAGAGYFAFASQLAIQVTSVLSLQIALVLQPVFSHMQSDRERQAAGFCRSLRLFASVGVPLCLVQAALGVAVFETLFEPKWAESIPIFMLLSIAQGFIFLVTPMGALLKAQGRFKTYAAWQLAHVLAFSLGAVLVAPAMATTVCSVIARIGLSCSEASAIASGVAVVSLVCWACSAPLGLWLTSRGSSFGFMENARAVVRAWIFGSFAAGACLGVWGVVVRLLGATNLSFVVTLSVGAIVTFFAVRLTMLGDPMVRGEWQRGGAFVRRILGRLFVRGAQGA